MLKHSKIAQISALILLMLLTVSLCTGSQLFLLLSILVLLTLAGAVIAVLWASATLEVEGELSGEAGVYSLN